MDEWHWHFAPIAVEGYGFKDQSKCYYARDTPDLVLDIVYTHEGEQCYISGLRGKGWGQQSSGVLRELLKKQGVRWARWEHKGQQMKWNILTGKITRDIEE